MSTENQTPTVKNSIQVIVCKCGAKFAGCRIPECYTETEWMKEVRKYVKNGCTIKILEAGSFNLEKCKCAETEKQNDRQLSMF